MAVQYLQKQLYDGSRMELKHYAREAAAVVKSSSGSSSRRGKKITRSLRTPEIFYKAIGW